MLTNFRQTFVIFSTEWSVVYVGILLSAMSCATVCGICYFSCKSRQARLDDISFNS